MEQFYRLKKVAYHNSANSNFISFDFTKDTHIAGRNNLGKTAKLNGIQMGYLPHANFKSSNRKFNFDKDYTDEASFDFYFPHNNSYIIYEFENPHGTFCQIVYRGNGDLQIERAFIPKSYDEILHWFWVFEDNDEIGLPTRISRKDFTEEVNSIKGSKIVKSATEAKSIMYNGSLTNYELGKFSVASVNENRVDNILDILKLTSNASSIDSDMLRKIVISLLKTSYQDNARDSMQYNPVELLEQFTRIKTDRELLTRKKNYLSKYEEIQSSYVVLNQESRNQSEYLNLSLQSLNHLIDVSSKLLNKKIAQKSDQDSVMKNLSERGKALNTDINQLNGQIMQIKKSIVQKEDIEKQYNELMYGEDSHWTVYNGDSSRVIEEIDSLISDYKEELQAISNIEKTVRELKNEKENLLKLTLKKENIETQIKNIENLFISNEKVRMVSGKLHAINPSFSSLSDNLSDVEIDKIKDFISIFDEIDGNIMLNGVTFGTAVKPSQSVKDLTTQLDDLITEIESLNKHICKLEKFTNNDDVQQAAKVKKELKDIGEEKNVILKYQSVEDELTNLKKEHQELDESLNLKIEERKVYREKYSQEKSKLTELKLDIGVIKTQKDDLAYLKKEILAEVRFNNFEFEKVFIEVDKLHVDISNIDISIIKSRFATLKNAKGRIGLNLRELVSKQIVDDEQCLLMVDNVDYEAIYNTLVSKLSTIFDSIDSDEEELNKAFGRQAKLIMDLSGDLNHYLGRYKSYIRKLNNQLDSINLSSISKIEINAEFEPRVERFINVIESYGLSSDDAITSMDNGLEDQIRSFITDMQLDKSKNMSINVETLIKKVSLKYINENNFTTTKGSNGTSIITSIILISMFTREICGDDISLIMPINLDEIGSVDWNNTKTVYDFIKGKGFCLFSAAPTIPNTAIDMFDVIIPLEDYEFIENADVFLSNYRMTYHYTMGGLVEDESIIEIDEDDFTDDNLVETDDYQ